MIYRFKRVARCAAMTMVLAGLTSPASAQTDLTPEMFTLEHIICAADDHPNFKGVKALHDARPESLLAIDWISKIINIAPNFIVLGADFDASPTAFAARRGDQRYIVYDRAKFSRIKGQLSWFDIGVFAHEVGHHINGHTAGYNGEKWPMELEADRFAGFVVAKLGGSLEQALSKAKRYSEIGSKTHPPRRQRVQALTEGWAQGQSQGQSQGQNKTKNAQ